MIEIVRKIIIVLLVIIILLVIGFYLLPKNKPAEAPKTSLANPASQNCLDKGGSLEIKSKPDNGGEYGVCIFEDNRQCEEWALFRGECPAEGVKITGYDDEAQIYCAITGGSVDMQEATCTLKDGSVCGLEAYYQGQCPN